jgi:integrase
MAEGIERRETARGPRYVARVYDAPSGKRVSRSFPTQAEARKWRTLKQNEAARGIRLIGTPQTLGEAADAFLEGIESGAIRSKRGTPYKPSAARGYRNALELHIIPAIGRGARLSRIQRRDVQRIVDDMLARRSSPSTIRNAVKPLQAIYRRAIENGELAASPCERLRLPAAEGKRDRIATPDESGRLLAALTSDRALWSAAFYAGLRLGELRALDWSRVDLAAGVIRVERAMDATGVIIEPKSKAGRRTVPIIEPLRRELVLHRLATGREDGYVFGVSASKPFAWAGVMGRAGKAWLRTYECGCASDAKKDADVPKVCREHKRPSLAPIGLHEARHTYASWLIAAGVNVKAISTYMGHGSVSVTLNIYGHLLPGNEAEAAGMLERFLELATK